MGTAEVVASLLKAGADPKTAERGAAGRPDLADAGGPHRERRHAQAARGAWRERECQGEPDRHDGPDVGGRRRSSRRGQSAGGAGADVNLRSRVTDYPHTPPGVIGDKLEPGASYVGQTVLPKGGWTALMYAARQGAREAARALADAKADLDVTDPDGSSALIFAIINGHYDVAKLLVEKGRRREPRGSDRGDAVVFGRRDAHDADDVRPARSAAAGGGGQRRRREDAAGQRRQSQRDADKQGAQAGLQRRGRQLDDGATPLMRAAKGGRRRGDADAARCGRRSELAQKNGNSALLLAAALGPKGGSDNNPDKGTYRRMRSPR